MMVQCVTYDGAILIEKNILIFQPPVFDTTSIMESLDQRDNVKTSSKSAGMSMDDFYLLSVLGRGHFGKVSLKI